MGGFVNPRNNELCAPRLHEKGVSRMSRTVRRTQGYASSAKLEKGLCCSGPQRERVGSRANCAIAVGSRCLSLADMRHADRRDAGMLQYSTEYQGGPEIQHDPLFFPRCSMAQAGLPADRLLKARDINVFLQGCDNDPAELKEQTPGLSAKIPW